VISDIGYNGLVEYQVQIIMFICTINVKGHFISLYAYSKLGFLHGISFK